MLLSLPMNSFLWILSLKFKETSFSGPMLIEIPEVGTLGRNTHQDMRKRGIIGLKIGLFVPTMTTHHQVQQKAVSPLQLEIEGEVPTPLGLLETGVAGGSDCLCPGSRLSSFWQVWETKNAQPRVVTILKEGYCLNFRNQPPLTNYPAIRSKYLNREKQDFLIKAIYQKSDNSSSKGHFPGILQSVVSCPQTRKEMATSNRSECGKSIFAYSYFQDAKLPKIFEIRFNKASG